MSSIYKHFAPQTLLPIKLQDVKEFVLRTGRAHAIVRFPVDIDELVLRGMLRVFRDKPPYAQEERVMAQIAYYKGLNEAWTRLVCCKEMLHLLDGHQATAETRDEVAHLIEDVTLPIEAVVSLPGLNDHTKLIEALCILVPTAAANLLRESHAKGDLSADDLAKVARIPEAYARVVLTDRFADLQNEIMVQR